MQALGQAAAAIRQGCTHCGACQVHCAFLSRYGTPGEIAATVGAASPEKAGMAFECSLCGLCRAVCPEKLDPGAWFMALRRAAVTGGGADLSRYATITRYEKIGTSPLFSCYAFPPDCDTIFFPGCTLPGTRPATTWKLFRHLVSRLPSLGIVLDCCTKPSHDLGRQHHFNAMFGEMVAYLKDNGIKRVWLACPSCHKIFTDHAPQITVETVYEVIDRQGLPRGNGSRPRPFGDNELVVHDPCPMRHETTVQASVRSLLAKLDIPVGKMAFQNHKTLCCGEGGSVGFVDPKLAGAWTAARKKTARGRTIVTYCAGCAGFLNRITPTVHIADLLFFADKAANGGLAPARAPFTYLHRLRFKHWLKKHMPTAHTRVRRFVPEK